MNEKHIRHMSFMWNMAYSVFNALQSSIILFAISRRKDLSEAGIITIGFTLATLAMIIARYGIRNYQVTDTIEEYSFSDYFFVRIATVFSSILFAIVYVAIFTISGKYTIYKGLVVTEIVILKMVDAFEGVYVGRFQQTGRLDVGARIATCRLVISTIGIFACVWLNVSIPMSFLVGILIGIIADIIFICKEQKCANLSVSSPDLGKIKHLIVVAFPLCIGMTMHNYIGNAPKYLVDFYMSDEMQAISGYIMMPMFVITVLNSFLMQPTVKALGDAWNHREIVILEDMIKKHILSILFAAIGVLLMGIFIGIPMISWMYQVNLKGYSLEFAFIMVGGTIYTISAYIIVILTAMRRQFWIMGGCAVTILIYIVFGKNSVSSAGLIGASVIYIIANALLLFIYISGTILTIRKEYRRYE